VVGEYEPFEGRTTYADKQAGGYYASRFSTVEYLHNSKKQARVLTFREISEKYVVPLGVWVVRSTVKHAFDNAPVKFSTLKEALNYAGTKIKIPLSTYMSESRMLKQRRLAEFI
jgi:hypothetical protein